MPAQEIPRQQWPRFLGDFVYRHFAWNVTLEQRRGRTRRVAADRRFLQQLCSEHSNGHQQITIVLGTPFERYRTHVVPNPKHVRFVAARDAVEIDTGDGRTVVVSVRRSRAA